MSCCRSDVSPGHRLATLGWKSNAKVSKVRVDGSDASPVTTCFRGRLNALTGGGTGVGRAVGHLLEYYDPAGESSGATFLEVETYDDYSVTAADLWVVRL